MPTDPSTPSETWTDLCDLKDLPDSGGKYVPAGNKSLAVFKQGERVCVINDTCPHAGGSLASGWVQDGVVYCPWHAWPFEIESGQCPDNPGIKVPRYETRVVEGKVQARI